MRVRRIELRSIAWEAIILPLNSTRLFFKPTPAFAHCSSGLRNHPVGITGSQYLPLDNEWQIRESLDQTVDLINQTKDPYTQALIAICMISYIQPFADGNKRTARMLGNALLLSQDLLPISYRTVSEVVYKDALIVFYEQNTLAPFKQIFIDQVKYANQTYFRVKDSS